MILSHVKANLLCVRLCVGSLYQTVEPTYWILLAVVVALGVGVFLYLRSRPPEEEPVFHCNCPHCNRRFRFGPKQVGRKVRCPQCKQQFVLPAGSKE